MCLGGCAAGCRAERSVAILAQVLYIAMIAETVVDVDGNSCYSFPIQGIKRPRRLHEQARPGPFSLVDVLSTPRDSVVALLDFADAGHPEIRSWLTDFAIRGIVVSETFAGAGTATHAARQVYDECRLLLAPDAPDNFIVWSHTDTSSSAQIALAAHGSKTHARHRFSDVLHRLPSDTSEELGKLQTGKVDELACYRAEFELGVISQKEPKDAKTRIAGELLAHYTETLPNVAHHEKVWCLECMKLCPVSPRF